jgi:DNA-binding transcriptional ArsR family regulator
MIAEVNPMGAEGASDAADQAATTLAELPFAILGALLDALGMGGVVVVLVLGALLLGKSPAARKVVGKAMGKAWSALIRYARISLWAAYLRMPVRLAYRLQRDRWREMCEARKLSGLKRTKVKRSPMGVDVLVTLNRSLTLETLTARISDLETGLGVKRGSIRIEGRESANKALIRIRLRDPLAKALPWEAPDGPVSIKRPVRLAMTPYGEWIEIDLRQRILVVGASGAGKSSVQRVLSAPVVLAVDAEIEVWDLKQGTESQHYEGKAVVRVTDAEGCAARIEYLLTVELEQRSALMKRLGTSTWPTSPEHPDRIVMIDEIAKLIRELPEAALKRFFTLLEQARAYGIYVWIATQFPKATNLPTEIRSQMSALVGMKMRRKSESKLVFEELTDEGWLPHRLPGRGWLLLLDDEHDEPSEAKAPFIPEGAFRELESPRPVTVESSAPAAVDAPALTLVKDQPTVPAQPVPAAAPSASELVLDALREGEVTAAELVRSTGRSQSQVYAALKALVESGAVVKSGKRYALAADQDDQAAEVTA